MALIILSFCKKKKKKKKSQVPFIKSLDYKPLSKVLARRSHKVFFFLGPFHIPHIHWVQCQVRLRQLSIHVSTKAYFCIISLAGWGNISFLRSIPIEAEGSTPDSWDEKGLWLFFDCCCLWSCFSSVPVPSLLAEWITWSWLASVPWPACVMFCGQPESWTDRSPSHTPDIWRAFLWNECTCRGSTTEPNG